MERLLNINNQDYAIQGNFVKTIRLADEWIEDIPEPESLIMHLREAKIHADILTFWQRLPEIIPKYPYFTELESIAAIPVDSYDNWFTKQIAKQNRATVRKAEKMGVKILTESFNQELVRGVYDILNSIQIRQGRPFVHYGRSIDDIHNELQKNAHRTVFIGAYFEEELIGYIQLVLDGRCAHSFGLIAKEAHRDKSSQNAMLAKAVKICEEKGIEYLIHGLWLPGGLELFKKNNGFVKFDLPRYFVPLTFKGRMVIGSGLHRGVKSLIPVKYKERLKYLKSLYYKKKLSKLQ
jgi:hypothetical protein